MNTWLAYKSNRAYVFQDYIWKRGLLPWTWWKERSWPWVPHTPLNALIAGPSAGGPWDHGDHPARFPNAGSTSSAPSINDRSLTRRRHWETGDVNFNHWQQFLRDAPERCIEIQPAPERIGSYPHIFDLFLWGSDRIFPLWEDFKNSPVSRLLATSPIFWSAIYRNEYLFQSRGPSPPPQAPRSVYERMLAIHLRRGNFQDASFRLANGNSTFYSWNLHPSPPDKFLNPPGYTWGKNAPENVEIYLKCCYPTY